MIIQDGGFPRWRPSYDDPRWWIQRWQPPYVVLRFKMEASM